MEYSMEFHGTLVPPNEISLSSMEFHGTLRLSFYSIPCYPGLPWDIPWNSMELWSHQIKNHRVSWDSMELGGRRFKWHKCSMELHGIFHGIPWNSGTAEWNITWFHGIPWNIPWNCMELWCHQMKYNLVPWNTMELWDCHFIQYHVTLDFHGIFHEIPWNPGAAKWNIT